MNCISKLCSSHENAKLSRIQPDSKPKQKLHYFWMTLPLSFALAIFTISYIAFFALPEPRYDIFDDNTGKFVEEYDLIKLNALSNIGPRVVGSSENEEEAITFLKNTLEEIRSEALDKYVIEYEVQEANGSLATEGMVSAYMNIQNFVVRFFSPCCNSTSALLLNSHFDTVPGSPGTGDDATMVVVMLEVLRVLSKATKTLKHPVIFLFNGAKENSQQGSHAFITQHEWAKDVKAFINLDSMGLGGREILFRSAPGHPWLMKHYSKSVLHPFASTIVEDMFKYEIMTLESDYQIFHDYGKIPGLDMGHMYNGYVHHTKYDNYSSIGVFGFLQHTGDNVLALVKSLASSDELLNPNDQTGGDVIYFDYLGLFVISYTDSAAIAINFSIVVISLTAMSISMWSMSKTMDEAFKFTLKEFALALLIQIGTSILVVAIPLILAVIIDAAKAPLFWYTQEWLIFGIYFCPACFLMAFIPSFYLGWKHKTFPLRFGVQMFLHAHCLLLIIAIIILTSLSVHSTFTIVMNVVFYTISVIINWALGLQCRPCIWLLPVLLCQIIPALFHSYSSLIFFTTYIPTTGQNGPSSDPELVIASYTIIFAILITGFLAPLFSICRKSKTTISVLMIIFFIFAIIMATPVGLPFSKDTAAQRLWVFHTQQSNFTFHINKNGPIQSSQQQTFADSGIVVFPFDRYSGLSTEDLLSTLEYEPMSNQCSNLFMCGIPVYSAKMKPFMDKSLWIKADVPEIPIDKNATFLVRSWHEIGENRFQLELDFYGPAHMQLFLKPMNGCRFFNSSLLEDMSQKDFFDDNIYFIQLRHGLTVKPFPVVLGIQTPADYDGPLFDMALIGHYTNIPINHTNGFKQFINSLPDWVAPTSIVSSYARYIVY